VTITVDVLMDGYDAAVRTTAENIERVHGKHWDARLDIARTVVSITAPIFAGTVIFLDRISSNDSGIQAVSLIASWAGLVVSITAGLLVFLQTVTLRSFHPKAFNGQLVVKAKFSTLDLTAPDAPNQAVQIVRQATDEILNAIGKADARARNSAAVCLTAFGISMLCFLIYALARGIGNDL